MPLLWRAQGYEKHALNAVSSSLVLRLTAQDHSLSLNELGEWVDIGVGEGALTRIQARGRLTQPGEVEIVFMGSSGLIDSLSLALQSRTLHPYFDAALTFGLWSTQTLTYAIDPYLSIQSDSRQRWTCYASQAEIGTCAAGMDAVTLPAQSCGAPDSAQILSVLGSGISFANTSWPKVFNQPGCSGELVSAETWARHQAWALQGHSLDLSGYWTLSVPIDLSTLPLSEGAQP